MHSAAVAIPEKLFFKIGEVCELTGVQAHVLRYWESEFPMLSPQKNRAGQRTYRRRDVEIALRIRELLYDDMYTIAGARKKLGADMRGASKLKVVTPDMNGLAAPEIEDEPRTQFSLPMTVEPVVREEPAGGEKRPLSLEQRTALRKLTKQLRSVLDLLEADGGRA
jgi:DNA-binding transcriptional MerR regulator